MGLENSDLKEKAENLDSEKAGFVGTVAGLEDENAVLKEKMIATQITTAELNVTLM